jgi:hypothetical protein
MAAGVAPRLVLIIMWIFGTRISIVFMNRIWLLILGIIFLPYTTIMFVLVWSPAGGVVGWDWIWLALGVMLDIMKWGQIANNRRQVPGYPQSGY